MTQRKKIKIRQRGTNNPIKGQPKSSGFNLSRWWKKNGKGVLIVGGGLTIAMVFFFLISSVLEKEDNRPIVVKEEKINALKSEAQISEDVSAKIETPNEERNFVGFNLDEYEVDHHVFSQPQNIIDFFEELNISRYIAEDLKTMANDNGFKNFETGHDFYTLKIKDDSKRPFFIYRISPARHAIIRTHPDPSFKLHEENITVTQKTASAIIKTNLWDAILKNNIPHQIIEPMEAALKWSVDFYHLTPGDRFKVIYQEESINGKVIGIRQIDAITFQTQEEDIFACYVDELDKPNYFDYYGRSLRRKFLKSPVKYGRISSEYNTERIHPVLNEKRPHYGTDYAAPLGAPIYAVADGKISLATFTKNNGNYVKIRHDETYETQYLHMSEFAKGIRSGSKIKQGQVIGFVGQTGLATGPHVCFRFWKAGQQIDHLKEKIVTQNVLNNALDEEAYIERRDDFMEKLDAINYDSGI